MAGLVERPAGVHGCRWVVVDYRGVPIEVITRFLGHLHAREVARNTLRAYASDLRYFATYLESQSTNWTDVNGETLAYFVAFLRKPRIATVGRFSGHEVRRAPSTVNRCMAAVSSFYKFMAHSTGEVSYSRIAGQAQKRWRPVVTAIDGVANTQASRSVSTFGPRLRQGQVIVKTLTVAEVHAIVAACNNRRDSFFFMLLFSTGLRVSQALSLRHSDLSVPDGTISIFRRDQLDEIHANKSIKAAKLPISRQLARMYLDYMFDEFKDLDSDYIFVNIWKGEPGRPLSYKNVYDLVKRLEKKTGIVGWSPHTFRHTFVSLSTIAGVSIDVISHLVTHGSIQTTVDLYQHLDVEDLRLELVRRGVWEAQT